LIYFVPWRILNETFAISTARLSPFHHKFFSLFIFTCSTIVAKTKQITFPFDDLIEDMQRLITSTFVDELISIR